MTLGPIRPHKGSSAGVGDRVVSHVDFDDDHGKVEWGDVGTVEGHCSEGNVPCSCPFKNDIDYDFPKMYDLRTILYDSSGHKPIRDE